MLFTIVVLEVETEINQTKTATSNLFLSVVVCFCTDCCLLFTLKPIFKVVYKRKTSEEEEKCIKIAIHKARFVAVHTLWQNAK